MNVCDNYSCVNNHTFCLKLKLTLLGKTAVLPTVKTVAPPASTSESFKKKNKKILKFLFLTLVKNYKHLFPIKIRKNIYGKKVLILSALLGNILWYVDKFNFLILPMFLFYSLFFIYLYHR